MSTTTQPVAAGGLAEDKIGREDKAALLCCHEPEYAAFLAGELRAMGYKLHLAATHHDAIQRLGLRSYGLTVVLENLEGCRLKDNLLCQHLAALPTDERRVMYVVLLCQSFVTGDAMCAYANSVDRMVNYADIGEFQALVGPALEEHEEENYHFRTVGARLLA